MERIAVLGAGCAGLAAAYELRQKIRMSSFTRKIRNMAVCAVALPWMALRLIRLRM